MATFYESENTIQIIDGQQRIISLSLIAKALGKYNEFIQLIFQRDQNQERKNFLENNHCEYMGTDVLHMKTAFEYLQNHCFSQWTAEQKKR